jgi:hypothetical protein
VKLEHEGWRLNVNTDDDGILIIAVTHEDGSIPEDITDGGILAFTGETIFRLTTENIEYKRRGEA